jgi:phage terminase large subunit GpA-like protein
MVRILLLIILGWALYLIIKRLLASVKHKTSEKPEETFVQCAHCGCHVPESESQIKNNQIICNNPECQTLTNQKDQHGD